MRAQRIHSYKNENSSLMHPHVIICVQQNIKIQLVKNPIMLHIVKVTPAVTITKLDLDATIKIFDSLLQNCCVALKNLEYRLT